jgi:hypothetical protein
VINKTARRPALQHGATISKAGRHVGHQDARPALQSTALEACLRLSLPQLKTVSFAHNAPHRRCLSR